MKTFGTVAALLSLAACMQSTPAPVVDTREVDIKALSELEASAIKAWAAKDINGIMAQYADNAVLVVPEAPVAKGAEAIRGMLAELLKDPAMSIILETSVTEVSGDLGYQRGNYTLQVTDPKTKKAITEKGTTLIVSKRQADGSWKVVEDFNTALPAAPQ